MQIFLAGENGKKKIIPIVHGGGFSEECDQTVRQYKPYILESFYYADSDTEKLMPFFGDFLLDSGAFTFMGGFSFTKNEKERVEVGRVLRKICRLHKQK